MLLGTNMTILVLMFAILKNDKYFCWIVNVIFFFVEGL